MSTAMDDLDAIADATVAVKKTKVDSTQLPAQHIHNGYYTLTFPCGTHRTFRLFTQAKGKFAGKRMMGMLIGPDNTNDYETFAFLTETGFAVWKRFTNQKQAEYASKLWKMLNGEILDDHELIESRRCLKCNRKLTDPESAKLGIGPSCRGDK